MLTEEQKKGKKIVEKISEEVTLNLFKYGCDKKNFLILKSLPKKVDELEREFKLSKMPMNRRLNNLEKVGLLKWDKPKGNINSTYLTRGLIRIIGEIREDIIKEMANCV